MAQDEKTQFSDAGEDDMKLTSYTSRILRKNLLIAWLGCFGITTAALVRTASAQETLSRTVSGSVLSADARLTSDGSTIVTEAVIRTNEGEEIPVTQVGGEVGELKMEVIPGPNVLRAGTLVTVALNGSRTVEKTLAWTLLEILSEQQDEKSPLPENSSQRYARSVSEEGHNLYWPSGCVYLTYDASGTSALETDYEFRVLDKVVKGFMASTQSCSYLSINIEPRSDMEVGRDGINVIKFRDSRWCRPAIVKDGKTEVPEVCYSPRMVARTTVTSIKKNGQIVDSDIEFNGVNFAISDGGKSKNGNSCGADLANTMMHELGHLIGLAHTCRTDLDDPRLKDQFGNPIPACKDEGAITDTMRNSTMFPTQVCGETSKFTLEADDVQGVCATYPIAKNPYQCKPSLLVEGGLPTGCSTQASTPMTWTDLISALAAALGLLSLRRLRASRKAS